MYARRRKQCCKIPLQLMKSINKTETPVFYSVVCSLFFKGNFIDVYSS